MVRAKCEYCHLPATHTNSVPDRNTRGYNVGECGYKRVNLCVAHALQAKEDSCHRVERMEHGEEEDEKAPRR